MKYKNHFKRILTKESPESYKSVLIDMEKRYLKISESTEFSKSSTNPLDKRLDLAAHFLATIQTLLHRQVNFQKIKIVCTEIASEHVRPKNKLQKWIKKLPPKHINTKLSKSFLKMMDKKISKKVHENGFLAKVITNKKQTFGFGYGIDILKCGICKLFNKHNANQYTIILCEIDKITSSMTGLELIRKGTIATGTEKCDFRFKKK